MPPRRLAILVTAVLAGVAVLAGCSKDPVADRNASGVGSRRVCPEQSSWSLDMPMWNFLPNAVTFEASEVACFDWSGVSNPSTAFDGLTIAGGGRRTVRLEPGRNVSRNWRLTFTSNGAATGTARFNIPATLADALNIETSGAPSYPRWSPNGERTESRNGDEMVCKISPLAPTDLPPTSRTDLERLRTGGTWAFGIVSFDSTIALAQCADEIQEMWGF